jgi:hypothetical protein
MLGLTLVLAGLAVMCTAHRHAFDAHHHELAHEAMRAVGVEPETPNRALRAQENDAHGHAGGHTPHHSCGNHLPGIREQVERGPVVEPVTYGSNAGRSLQLGGFETIDDAHAAGRTGKIRVELAYDHLDGDTLGSVNTMCRNEGETVQVTGADGSPRSWTCTTDAVVIAGNSRNAQIRERVNWAASRIAATLWVKPASGGVAVSPMVAIQFNLRSGRTQFSNADLVVFVTARPSPFQNAAGWATCVQSDQYGRCTVGHLNIVPELLNVAEATSPPVVVDERHTALHELVHVLGGISADAGHVDSTGAPMAHADVFSYAKALSMSHTAAANNADLVATFLRTQRVLTLIRAHFNCSNLPGAPLEDLPFGRSAHWEARVMGPELMSYGSGSGDVYVSDLTVAMLEDTNHYRAPDYSLMTGSLYDEAATDALALAGFAFLRGSPAVDSSPPAPRPPGALRWGAGQGCGFVLGDPSLEWDSRYLCFVNSQYGCTPDFRMSSVCAVKVGVGLPSQYSCGYRDQDGGCNRGPTLTEGCVSNAGCALPAHRRHFNSTTITNAFSISRPTVPSNAQGDQNNPSSFAIGRVGGFSDAMDQVPIQLGYWSCLYSAFPTNSSTRNEGGTGAAGSDAGSAIQSGSNTLLKLGGQTFCKQCRCFQSSLRELTTGTTSPVRYGMCYAANCYRSDYLQVAVRSGTGGDGVSWYRCPPAGGNVFIPGFTGTLVCPPAKQFCATQEVTGIKHAESQILYQIVFYVTVASLFVLFVLFCLIPPCRSCLIRRLRNMCRIETFVPEQYDEILKDWHRPSTIAPPCYGNSVLLMNVLVMSIGFFIGTFATIAVVRGVLVTTALPVLALGVMYVIVSGCGSVGVRSWSVGPSCGTLVFVYTSILLAGFVAIITAVIAFNPSSLQANVSRSFDLVVQALPPSAIDRTADSAAQIQQAVTYLSARMIPIAGAVAGSAGLVLLSGMTAACSVPRAILATVNFFTISSVMILPGLGFLAIGTILKLREASAQASFSTISLDAMIIGGALILHGLVSCCSARNPARRKWIIVLSSLVSLALGIGGLYAASVFLRSPATFLNVLSSLPDSQAAVLQDMVGGGLTRAEMLLVVESYLLTAALALLIIGIVWIIHAVSGCTVAGSRPPVRVTPAVDAVMPSSAFGR